MGAKEYKNLTANTDKTPEELSERGRRAGIASGEAKRRKKTLRETAQLILDLQMKPGKVLSPEDVASVADLTGQNVTADSAVVLSMLSRALKGNVRAAEWLRDTAGENPALKLESSPDSALNIRIEYDDGA